MAANLLETVGDNATLGYTQTGTLTNGTLTSGTLTAGALGGAVVAIGTLTMVGSIYDITPNKITVAKVETTKLASPSAESQPGTPDYGEVQLTVPFSYSFANAMNTFIAAKALIFFKATVDDFSSTDSSEAFLGWVKEFTPLGGELKKDESAKASLTIQITGTPLLATGT